MARTQTITQSQILEAARVVFLEQGFSATTVVVANRAGISSLEFGLISVEKGSRCLALTAVRSIEDKSYWQCQLCKSDGRD